MAAVEVMEMLRRSGGIEAVSKQLGIPPAMASAGADALVPVILGGFGKHAGTSGGGESGLGALIGMLGSLGGGSLAANVLGPEETDVSKGNEVLGQIFGSKDVSRSVAADAAGKTGIDPGVLKKMLPILAMLVGGYLSARAGGSGAQGSGGLGGLSSILGSVLGVEKAGGGLGSLLDLDGDGNPLDDIIGMAGKLAR
jgi:hypothetical protein